MEWSGFGRLLIGIGVLFILLGLGFVYSDRLSFSKWIGRLPGDFSWKGEGWQVHFPLATSLLLSLILSLIFWLLNRGGKV